MKSGSIATRALVVRELSEVKYSGSPTPGEISQILQREATAIRRELTGRELVVALDAHGTSISSVELAEWIHSHAAEGRSQVAFVIGGSLGLDKTSNGKPTLRSLFRR